LHEVAPPNLALGLGPEDQPSRRQVQGIVVQHLVEQAVELVAADALKVGHLTDLVPRFFDGDAISRRGEDQQLEDE
jgi:hypothetical protein